MIREIAILNVRDGESAAFENTMAEAVALIRATPGFLAIRVQRCLETQGRYLLDVEWETLDAHEVGFRGSDRFSKWRAALHHFYEPTPTVQHYEAMVEAVGYKALQT